MPKKGHTSMFARFNIMSTILTVSVSLPAWGNPYDGCPDHSDKVKDPNPETPKDPCGGDYTFLEGADPVPVSWDWFHCVKSNKCIHHSGRCDKIPNPACIFENKTTGKTIVEDEDGCDYQGLISKSATYKCQSKNNNKDSLAVLSTVFNYTLLNSGDFSVKKALVPNVPVLRKGTIVTIRATRCDGVVECGDGSDENGCGMEVEDSILAGKTLLTYIFCQDFLFYTVNNYRQVTGIPIGGNFAFSYTGTAQKLYRQVL